MPLYDFTCLVCGKKIEVLQPMNKESPVCCDKPMGRGAGSMAFFRMKGALQGETRGSRMYAEEITRKTRK